MPKKKTEKSEEAVVSAKETEEIAEAVEQNIEEKSEKRVMKSKSSKKVKASKTSLKASSKKPKVEKKDLSKEEMEKQIVELAKQGFTSEKIGQKLKDQGIHTSEKKIKISRVLKAHGLYVQPDIKNVKAKLERMNKHQDSNKQDKRAKRDVSRVFSQLRKAKIYFNEQ